MLSSFRAKSSPAPAAAKMLASESLIAARRIEALFEEGLVSPDEKRAWDDRIARLSVSLPEIQAFIDGRWAQKK
ncbi:MAG TPA: hypothetical protein VII49_00685 [Rhizomicrobium sp.]